MTAVAYDLFLITHNLLSPQIYSKFCLADTYLRMNNGIRFAYTAYVVDRCLVWTNARFLKKSRFALIVTIFAHHRIKRLTFCKAKGRNSFPDVEYEEIIKLHLYNFL